MNKRISIRRATVRDLDILVHQRRGMWEDMGVGTKEELDGADRTYRKWARARLKSGEYVGWLAQNEDGEVIGGGCVWLQPHQPGPADTKTARPYLLSMYTEPKYREQGVGSRIVDETVRWSRRHGFSRLLLHASNKGRRLYAKKGFKRTWEMKLDL